jgi:hypothetical protein
MVTIGTSDHLRSPSPIEKISVEFGWPLLLLK